MEETNKHDMAIEFYAKLFYTNFQLEGRDQLSNMVHAARNFCTCFENAAHDAEELATLYASPIPYILKKFGLLYSQKNKARMSRVDYTLSQLEWVYWRDSYFYSSLKKEYFADSSKPQMMQRITLADVVALRGFVKMAVSDIFTRVVVANSVELDPLLLPQYGAPVQQVGVGE
jgi:hypothetical protein